MEAEVLRREHRLCPFADIVYHAEHGYVDIQPCLSNRVKVQKTDPSYRGAKAVYEEDLEREANVASLEPYIAAKLEAAALGLVIPTFADFKEARGARVRHMT
ncbi:hypothetical protein LTR78_009556 [Recurvomyces mirabilis]|uniref:Uncharacterized protein n=1 Tax=Recurvomyces mirabilis TaxID=574656 RepID=A0AAE0TNF5_9PEZI|nr:hypothetical protein LTR78_009556 [Recurvomyces mirabilis]KAK5149989.1 hypothetical protein LTS14_010461 [Recurvomyces mirabilis]